MSLPVRPANIAALVPPRQLAWTLQACTNSQILAVFLPFNHRQGRCFPLFQGFANGGDTMAKMNPFQIHSRFGNPD
jgi:hypothetical protein